MAAPPSWRQITNFMWLVWSCRASSTARKLSPGTPNMVSTPCSRSCSTRIWPPLRFMVCDTPLRSALDRCEGGRGHQAVFLIDQVAGLGALLLIGLPVGIGLHGGALGLAVGSAVIDPDMHVRSEEHTSEIQSLM